MRFEKKIELSEWKFGFLPNCECSQFADTITTPDEAEKRCKTYPAVVPGCLELDLMRNGIEKDPVFGTNSWEYQKYENMHVWYFTEFTIGDLPKIPALCFDGLDTIADIYVNGKKAARSENMMLPCRITDCGLVEGKNTVVVHFIPACIEARKYRLPAASNTLFYNYQSLYIRKPMHMYGWDIMPRFVSCGIYKSAYIASGRRDCIDELFVYTLAVKPEEDTAKIRIYFALDIESDFPRDYRFTIEGRCGDSVFRDECSPRGTEYNRLAFWIENCKLWWPKNQGEQALYDVEARLWRGKTLCDTYKMKLGIRTIELKRSETVDDPDADFCFIVNGRRVFINGTNWVPLEPFHSEDEKRLPEALALLDDSGVNMVRMWGGNLYESDSFFDFCDSHGIMVWQDFSMACAVYPNDRNFLDKLEPETIYTVKRLRGHCSLALWAGDNECDCTRQSWGGVRRDPNDNIITRELIPRLLNEHDFTRPYLPSSPYISPECHRENKASPEDHLWGSRYYFKSDFYKNAGCFFASEIGYHSCPSPETLRKMIGEDKLWPCFDEDVRPNDHWAAHAVEAQRDGEIAYEYRIRLLYNQVKLLFGEIPDDLDDYIRYAQISQAEAMKFFIESFRVKKPRRTGIIWWNLLDGWPIISDAVVDHYFRKKLAYKFMKRSGSPFAMIFDEPLDVHITLYACNDEAKDRSFRYKVRNVTDGVPVSSGNGFVKANENKAVCRIKIAEYKREMFLVEWETDDGAFSNHYCTNLLGINGREYLADLKKCGFDEFEGF